MKLKVKKNIIVLPFTKGDKYYLIQFNYSITERENRYDHVTNRPIAFAKSKISGYQIIEREWTSYWEIVQAIEHNLVGKKYFVSEENAIKVAEEEMKKGKVSQVVL